MINFSVETKKFKHVIDFYNIKFKNKDFSKLETVQLYFGSYFYGICHFPSYFRKKFLIKCRLDRRTIYPEILCFYVRSKNSQSIKLKGKEVPSMNCNESMVYLIGHELFHFLRATKQIKGKNTESQANEFAFKCLSEFKRNQATSS